MSMQTQFVNNVKSALGCFFISFLLHVFRFLLVSQLSKNQNSLWYYLFGLSSHCNGLWYLFHVFFAFFVTRLFSLDPRCTLSNGIILCHVLYFNCVLFIVLDANKNRCDIIREKLENLIADVRLGCNKITEKYKNRWENLREDMKFEKMPKPENQNDHNRNGIESFCRQKFDGVYLKAQRSNEVPWEHDPSKKRPLRFEDQKIENPKHPGKPDPHIKKLHKKIGKMKYKFIRDLIDIWFKNLPELFSKSIGSLTVE